MTPDKILSSNQATRSSCNDRPCPHTPAPGVRAAFRSRAPARGRRRARRRTAGGAGAATSAPAGLRQPAHLVQRRAHRTDTHRTAAATPVRQASADTASLTPRRLDATRRRRVAVRRQPAADAEQQAAGWRSDRRPGAELARRERPTQHRNRCLGRSPRGTGQGLRCRRLQDAERSDPAGHGVGAPAADDEYRLCRPPVLRAGSARRHPAAAKCVERAVPDLLPEPPVRRRMATQSHDGIRDPLERQLGALGQSRIRAYTPAGPGTVHTHPDRCHAAPGAQAAAACRLFR